MDAITLKPIHTEADYKAAMVQLNKLWDCPENSPEADTLEVLSILIEQYEKRTYPIATLDPVEAIRYEMEENGLSQRDMIKYFGSKERVSEVLNRKRPMTLKMVKALYHDLGIPASILLAK